MEDGTDWRSWMARHGPALVLLARQYVGSLDDAQDVMQEAFVRFWRSRHRAIDPTAYLYTCTRRFCHEWQRQHSRQRRRERLAAKPERSGADDWFIPIEQDERRRLIEAALAALPAEQREVVIMRLWSGLSFPQIGAATAVSPEACASRYRYAMAKLRRLLSEEHAP